MPTTSNIVKPILMRIVAGVMSSRCRHYRKLIIVRYRYIGIVISIFVLVFAHSSTTLATSLNSAENIIAIQYLVPTEEERDIKTTNIDVNFLLTQAEKVNLSVYWGMTATYASGNITQQGETSYNSAVGFGPGLLASFRVLSKNKFFLDINGSGNFIIYNKAFPEGADHYNFMWRAGLGVGYELDKSKAIGMGYEWMHVSNGQGAGPGNPGYEAKGVILRLMGFF